MPVSFIPPPRAALLDRPPPPPHAGSSLWLEFVNTDAAAQPTRGDLLRDFDALVGWLHGVGMLDSERAAGIRRRAQLQPASSAATVVDARRVRSALRVLAERGAQSTRVTDDAVLEINRVLGRSAGTRKVDRLEDGTFSRAFVPTGDAFAALMIPIVESAADMLVDGQIARVRRCANPNCHRVFVDTTKNGRRRWCDMGTCGNRAKAARHRAKSRGSQLTGEDA